MGHLYQVKDPLFQDREEDLILMIALVDLDQWGHLYLDKGATISLEVAVEVLGIEITLGEAEVWAEIITSEIVIKEDINHKCKECSKGEDLNNKVNFVIDLVH